MIHHHRLTVIASPEGAWRSSFSGFPRLKAGVATTVACGSRFFDRWR
jgi:hypothetical protein